jgi:outer membrane protein insertion porin family
MAFLATGLSGQIPYRMFDQSTQVSDIDFRFVNGRTFDGSTLRETIALTEQGRLVGVRRVLSFLPLVPSVGEHPFALLELQRDVARLRAFYAGFLGTSISYEVTYHDEDNEVDVEFIIDEGRPISVRSMEVLTPSGDDPAEMLPDSLRNGWHEFLRRANERFVGLRYTAEEGAGLRADGLGWWADRGWAFPTADVQVLVDSADAAADLRVRLEPGARGRIDSISIEGNEAVSDEVILATLPFEVGDRFSESAVTEGQRRLFGLDLFRLVLVDTPSEQPRDSTVQIRVRVQESAPRLFVGELGYMSTGSGITGGAELAHRNFLGGARTVRVSSTFRTGALAIGGLPEREYGLSISYRRPFIFEPRLSLSVAPYGRYRDNFIDRSWEAGIESTLIYELGALRYLTLQHRLFSRRVLDVRLGSGNSIDLTTLLALVAQGTGDALGGRIDRSLLSMSVTVGRFDPTSRARALQIQPVFQVTTPAPLNTVEFALVDLPIATFLPLGDRVALTASARVGRVYPFGKTLSGDSIAGLLEATQIRDVLLRAGGTGSVRGWGNGLLGPKSLDLLFTLPPGTDSIAVTSNGYLPGGGLARANASLEMGLPFPGLSDAWGTHLFLDAGRVWTPDERFPAVGMTGDEGWFFGTGVGIDRSTVVGPVRVSVGYKVNPSPLDLRDAAEVLHAIMSDQPLSSVATRRIRRFHLHVALGTSP